MKKINVFIYIAIIVLVLASSVFYAFKNKDVEEGQEIIISKESTEDYILDKYKDGFITYNGMELIHYNCKMEQKWVLTIDNEDAELYVNGDYIILHSQNSDKIYLVKDGNLLKEIKTDKTLRVASVNENGYISALTSDKGYKGQCFVYDKNGKVVAEYSFGEKYVLGAYLAADNYTLVMNVIEDHDGYYQGKILFADTKSGEIKEEIESEKIYSYVNIYKNRIYAGTDKALFCYDKNGKVKWSYSYESGEAMYIGLSGKYLTLVLKTGESFGGNEVLTFNLSGRLKGSYLSESQISAFDSSEGYSAIEVNGEIILLDRRGKIVSSVEAENNVNEIKLYKNENRVLTLSEKASMKKFSR